MVKNFTIHLFRFDIKITNVIHKLLNKNITINEQIHNNETTRIIVYILIIMFQVRRNLFRMSQQ